MCVIIHKPKGIKLDYAVYAECFHRNNHGGGFAYVGDVDKKHTQGVVIDKGFLNAGGMIDAIKKHEDNEMIIHFRRASCGGMSPGMCHPFGFDGGSFPQYSWALVHNGTLPYRSEPDKSDTACFVEDIMGPTLQRDPYFLQEPETRFFLESFMGKGNKFAVMRYDSTTKKTLVYIVNKKEGVEAYGCWFSNASFRPLAPAWEDYRHMGALSRGTAGRDWPDGSGIGGYVLNRFGFWQRVFTPPTLPDKPEATSTNAPKVEQAKATYSPVHRIIAFQKQLAKESRVDHGDRGVLAAIDKKIRETHETPGGKIIGFVNEDPDTDEAAFRAAQKEVDDEGDGVVINLAPGEIAVPRDAEVIKGTFPADRRAGIGHLTKRQKKDLRKLCQDYLRDLHLVGFETMDFADQLIWVREDLRKAVSTISKVADEDLDFWLLNEAVELVERDMLDKATAKRLLEEAVAEKAEALKAAQLTH